MDYKILEGPVTDAKGIKDLAEKAEDEGYELYAGYLGNTRYGYSNGAHFELKQENGILHNGKLFAATPHYTAAQNASGITTESAEAISEAKDGKSATAKQITYEELSALYNELRAENAKLTDRLSETGKTLDWYKGYDGLIREANAFREIAVTELAAKEEELRKRSESIGNYAREILRVL